MLHVFKAKMSDIYIWAFCNYVENQRRIFVQNVEHMFLNKFLKGRINIWGILRIFRELMSIRQNQLTEENIYNVLLAFDDLYDTFDPMENILRNVRMERI